MHNPQPLKIVTISRAASRANRHSSKQRPFVRFSINANRDINNLLSGRLLPFGIVQHLAINAYGYHTFTYFRMSDLPYAIDSRGVVIPRLERQRAGETVFPVGSRVLYSGCNETGVVIKVRTDVRTSRHILLLDNGHCAYAEPSELSLVSQPSLDSVITYLWNRYNEQPDSEVRHWYCFGYVAASDVRYELQTADQRPASTEFPTSDDLLSYSDPLSEFEAFAGGLSLADRAAGCICLPGSYSMECQVHQTRVLNSPQQFISAEGLEARQRIAGRNRFAEAFSR